MKTAIIVTSAILTMGFSWAIEGGGQENLGDPLPKAGAFAEAQLLKYDISSEDCQLLESFIIDYERISEMNKGALDVHQFNAQIKWKEKLPKLIALDEKYLHSDSQISLDTVIQGVENSFVYGLLTEPEKNVLQRAFLQIKAHLQASPIETGETGADMPQLISRCWSLSQFEGDRFPQDIFAEQGSAIEFIMNVLSENLLTFGGCYPGYSGRFCQLYLLLIKSVSQMYME